MLCPKRALPLCRVLQWLLVCIFVSHGAVAKTVREGQVLDFFVVGKNMVEIELDGQIKRLEGRFEEGALVINQDLVNGMQRIRQHYNKLGAPFIVEYHPLSDIDSGKSDGIIGFGRDSQFFLRFRYMELSRSRIRLQNSGMGNCIAPYLFESGGFNYTFNPKHDFALVPYQYWYLDDIVKHRISGPSYPYRGEEIVLGFPATGDYRIIVDVLGNRTCFVAEPHLALQSVHFVHNLLLVIFIFLFLVFSEVSEGSLQRSRRRRQDDARLNLDDTADLDGLGFVIHQRLFMCATSIIFWLLLPLFDLDLPIWTHTVVFMGLLVISCRILFSTFHEAQDVLLTIPLMLVIERGLQSLHSDAMQLVALFSLLNCLALVVSYDPKSRVERIWKVDRAVCLVIGLLYISVFQSVLARILGDPVVEWILTSLGLVFLVAVPQLILRTGFKTPRISSIVKGL